MAKGPLDEALTHETYELIGRANEALMTLAREKAPDVWGADLAVEVLDLVHPESGRQARQEGKAVFFERWLSRHGGHDPRSTFLEQMIRGNEVEAMREDLRWVGLAVMVVVFAGGLVSVVWQKRSEAKRASLPSEPPAPSSRRSPVHLAIVVLSGTLRETGTQPESAGALLTRSTHWWSGGRDEWVTTERSLGLSPIEHLPETDNTLVMVTYEMSLTDGTPPTSRPEGADRLRAASKTNALRLVGSFVLDEPSRLSAAGFRR